MSATTREKINMLMRRAQRELEERKHKKAERTLDKVAIILTKDYMKKGYSWSKATSYAERFIRNNI